MSLPSDPLAREIEKAIVYLMEKKGMDLATKIKSILYANLDRKRVQKFTEGDPGAVEGYVARVVEKYERFHSYIHQLQIERSNEVWARLIVDMRKWAYRSLIKYGCSPNKTTWEQAEECADEAARNILKAYFPFDADFEPWARVVVQNTCLKFLRNSAKDVPVVDESLDNLEGVLRSTAFSAENHDLQEALSQLPEIRRQVIEMKYFQGMSAGEIAQKTGKTVRAIHSLQFRGLEDLRKILTENRNKLNE